MDCDSTTVAYGATVSRNDDVGDERTGRGASASKAQLARAFVPVQDHKILGRALDDHLGRVVDPNEPIPVSVWEEVRLLPKHGIWNDRRDRLPASHLLQILSVASYAAYIHLGCDLAAEVLPVWTAAVPGNHWPLAAISATRAWANTLHGPRHIERDAYYASDRARAAAHHASETDGRAYGYATGDFRPKSAARAAYACGSTGRAWGEAKDAGLTEARMRELLLARIA